MPRETGVKTWQLDGSYCSLGPLSAWLVIQQVWSTLPLGARSDDFEWQAHRQIDGV